MPPVVPSVAVSTSPITSAGPRQLDGFSGCSMSICCFSAIFSTAPGTSRPVWS